MVLIRIRKPRVHFLVVRRQAKTPSVALGTGHFPANTEMNILIYISHVNPQIPPPPKHMFPLVVDHPLSLPVSVPFPFIPPQSALSLLSSKVWLLYSTFYVHATISTMVGRRDKTGEENPPRTLGIGL